MPAILSGSQADHRYGPHERWGGERFYRHGPISGNGSHYLCRISSTRDNGACDLGIDRTRCDLGRGELTGHGQHNRNPKCAGYKERCEFDRHGNPRFGRITASGGPMSDGESPSAQNSLQTNWFPTRHPPVPNAARARGSPQ
jgi:hypothetical protein